MRYESKIDEVIHIHRMLAICPYSLEKCGAVEVMDVLSHHRFALIRRKGKWEVIRGAEEDRLQVALEAQIHNFRNSLDESPLGIRIVSAEGETLYANRAILDISGYDSIEEMEATPSKKRYSPESYAEHRKRVEKRQRGEYVPSNYEIGIVRQDGEIRHLEVFRKEVLWNSKPQFQVLYNDITERKQAGEALRESNEKYQELFELGGEAIFLIDNASGRLLETNTAASHIYGYSRNELLTMRNVDLSAEPEDTRRVTRSTLTGSVLVPLRYHRRKDGTVFPVEITGRFFTWRGQSVHVAAIRDITERKKAEEALRESEEKLHLMFESVGDGIAVMELQGVTIIEANQRLADMHGFRSTKHMIGKGMPDLMDPRDNEKAMISIRKIIEEGADRNVEYTLIRADGSRFPGEINTRLLKDGKGNPVGLISSTRDITERKQAEEALHESEEKHRTLFETMSQGVVYQNSDGQIVSANPAAERILG